MLKLTGTVVNIYEAAAYKEGDEPKSKIQILGDVLLKSGEVKKDLIDITVPDASQYGKGEEVEIAVGAFAPKAGTVVLYAV